MSGHDHSHEVPESGGRLAIVMLLNFTITAAEIVGGLISGSLSLISDALHNFSDGIAVIIAWIAIRLDARPRTDRHTFGLKRAQVVAAVINAGALVAISVFLGSSPNQVGNIHRQIPSGYRSSPPRWK